jgi:hypothetical protein
VQPHSLEPPGHDTLGLSRPISIYLIGGYVMPYLASCTRDLLVIHAN